MVLARQVRPEDVDRREVHRPVRQQVQDDRELPRRPRGGDAAVRRVLGQVEGLRAVAIERVPIRERDVPRLELGEVRDELDGRDTLAPDERFHTIEERVVRQPGGGGKQFMHASCLAPRPARFLEGLSAPWTRANG